MPFSSAYGESTVIRFSNTNDENGKYASSMMKLALSYAQDKEYKYQELPENFTQKRSQEETLRGHINVMWAATDLALENELLPIRIPLYKGLLGHRIFLIRADDQTRFDNISTLAELKKIPIGQGRGWADTEILKLNGFIVYTPTKFESLMYMLDGGRFDAFPRGIFEPFREVVNYNQLKLTVEKKFLLVYKMPYYLFVSPQNKSLANDLESGLKKAIADGSFEKLFLNNPNVQEAIKNGNMQNRTSFYLDNPNLPPQTPIETKEYWLDLKDF
jgi:hypothetical protein